MKKALGIIEIRGLAAAVNVADAMVKSADVELKGVERAKGMGYMTVKITGDVGAVSAAVEAGKSLGTDCGKYITSSVIANPAPETGRAFIGRPEQEDCGKTGSEKTDSGKADSGKAPLPKTEPKAEPKAPPKTVGADAGTAVKGR